MSQPSEMFRTILDVWVPIASIVKNPDFIHFMQTTLNRELHFKHPPFEMKMNYSRSVQRFDGTVRVQKCDQEMNRYVG